MKTPLGPLPALSPTARRALLLTSLLSVGTALCLVAQAWALASALGPVVGTRSGGTTADWALLAGAVVARALLGWATESAAARAAAGAKEEIRAQLLDGALRRGPEWIQDRGPAELTALATRGLDALDAYFTRYLPALVTAAIVPPLIGAWILLHDWVSAGLIALTVPLVPVFAWLVGRFTEKRADRAAAAVRRLSGQLLELVRALPVLTAFGRAGAQGEVVDRVSEAHRRSSHSALRIAFLSALVLELLSSLSVALVAVGIGLRLVSGELDLTTGLLVLVLAPECYLPLRAVGAAHHASEDGIEALRRVDEVLGGQQEQPRRGDDVPEPGGRLVVRDLRVARRGGHAPDGLSFTACPGEIVRLAGYDGIGPSGSGKSTTFAVLLGFARAERGSVRYGGRALSELDEHAWRRLVAWVPQRPVFSGDTVADELRAAVSDQPAGTADDVIGPLASVRAEHLLHRRVDGLSTGERQRVAVARALLRLRGDACVLLADEPTAHLDGTTAEHVNEAIRRAAVDGAAVVLASHRPGAEPVAAEPARCGGEVPTSAETGARGRVRDLLSGRSWFGIALGALSLLSGVALTATSAWLISRASQQPPILTLTVAVVGVRAFALSRAALRYAERLVTHDAAFRLAGRLRHRLWEALVRLGPARAAALHRGEGLARLVDDADVVRDLVPRVLLPPLVGGVVALGAVAVETAVLPAAGALLAAALLVAGTAGPAAALAAERRASAAAAEGRRRIAGRALVLLDGAAELLAFGAHARRRAELRSADADVAARSRRAAFGAGAATAVLTLAVGGAVLGGAVLGVRAVAAGQLAPEMAPLLALVPLAAGEAVATLPQAAQSWRPLRDAQARTAALLAAPEQERAVVDGEDILLDGADVRWPGAAEPALRGVSLKIPDGAHVAIVGPSGGGKSTLLAALLGFLPAERGEVRAPRATAWCPQDPQLVATSVRENLRIAAPRSDDQRLADGLRAAGLPDADLDALVGPGGAQLSGGEAQRVALARALLREDARALLLDEPTAHLDVATSEALLERVHRRWKGATVVHVTHRWSETEHADVVLRVERGGVSVVRETAPAGAVRGGQL